MFCLSWEWQYDLPLLCGWQGPIYLTPLRVHFSRNLELGAWSVLKPRHCEMGRGNPNWSHNWEAKCPPIDFWGWFYGPGYDLFYFWSVVRMYLRRMCVLLLDRIFCKCQIRSNLIMLKFMSLLPLCLFYGVVREEWSLNCAVLLSVLWVFALCVLKPCCV